MSGSPGDETEGVPIEDMKSQTDSGADSPSAPDKKGAGKGGDGRKRSSLLRRVIGSIAPSIIVLIVLEVVVRVGAWAWHGWNEYYLFYGIHGLVGRLGVSPWSVYDGSHFKFPPNYTLQSAAGQGEETARTNSLGFRGPDFEPTKPADTYRVITLGGSSTFGFHNEDDATYPHHLQRLFDAGLAGGESEGPRFEVINSGFPYYTTASIRSLLESEVIDYDPDLITLYTAYNDASWPLSVNAALRGLFWVQQHSSIYLVLKETLLPDRRVYQLQNRMRRNLQATINMGEIDADAEAIARRYRENLEAIVDLAEARGIRVLMIRQPMTTSTVNAGIDSLSYEQEFLAIREALPGQSYVNPMELRMIYHHRLLEEGDAIARERGLTVIDNVAITDEDRSGLTTWVHLTGEANHRLAQALHATIRDIARASVEDLPGEPNRDQGTAEDSR